MGVREGQGMALHSLPLAQLIEALPLAGENLSGLAKSVDRAIVHKLRTSDGGHRILAAWPTLSPAAIAPLLLGVSPLARRLPVAWWHSVPVARIGCATPSTDCHPPAALTAPGLHASPEQCVHVAPDRWFLPTEPCNRRPPYGSPECSALNPDSFPAPVHDGRSRPFAART